MHSDDEQLSNHRLRNTLGFSPQQTSYVLGRSLQKFYQDLLTEELPERFRAMIQQLEKADYPGERAN
jgi:hypothetical protein